VKKLKEKIEEEKGKETFPAAGQKLIYAGLREDTCLFYSHLLIRYIFKTIYLDDFREN
jgi:hypothetical protein